MARLDENFNRLLGNIMDQGKDRGDRTGTGTRSIFDWKIEHDMENGFPLLTSKKMFSKGIITELLWFLNGDTNIQALVKQGNNIWVGDAYKKYVSLNNTEDPLLHLTKDGFIEMITLDDKFAKKWGELGPIYGKQWVSWGHMSKQEQVAQATGEYGEGIVNESIDQIQNVIDTLNTNPESRRIMVSAWNVAEINEMTLPPCHWAFEFYTEELTFNERVKWVKENNDVHYIYDIEALDELNVPKRRLSLKWHQRSVDTPLGLPFNIASYGFLLEMIAQQVNMVPGTLIGDLSNVHIYQNQYDGVKEQLERDTSKFESPKLKLNKAKDIFSYKLEDFEIVDYESDPTIKFPLSN